MVEPLPETEAARLQSLPFSYEPVGATARGRAAHHDSSGYTWFEYTRVLVSTDLDRAARDLLTWRVHERAGLRVAASGEATVPGAVVLMRLGVGPVALRIPCRVVGVIDEPDARGFCYGTLPGHPESGEERFVIRRQADGALRFVVDGFSRPETRLTRLAGPAGRFVQGRMTRRYLRAVDRAR
jgi:uncharacterized protein (UPF0548 family)